MAAYFETVGIFDQAHLGVVDTGWVGNVQVFLTDAIRKAKPGHVFTCTGFYVYLRRQPDARAGGTRCYSRNARAMITGLVELFTAADHGSVKAYDKDAPNFVRLSSEKNKEGLEWGLPVQQSVIESYARIFANMTKGYPLPLDTLAAEIKIVSSLTFSRFFLEPTTQEAVVYGSYPHADDPAHLIYHELAPVFNLQQMFRRFILKDFLTVSHWPAATILRSCRHYLLYLPAGYVLYCIRRRKEKNRKWML